MSDLVVCTPVFECRRAPMDFSDYSYLISLAISVLSIDRYEDVHLGEQIRKGMCVYILSIIDASKSANYKNAGLLRATKVALNI